VSHLGERTSALVDGELSHDQRERALAHLTRCAECRAEVDAERRVKAVIREQTVPSPSPDLVASLLRLAEPGDPLPPDRVPFPGPARRTAGWRPAAGRPGSRPAARTGPSRPGRSPRLRRGLTVATGGVLTAAAATVGLALLGGTGPGAPAPVVPPVEQFTVEHVRSTSSQPFADGELLLDTSPLSVPAPASLRAPASQSGPSADPGTGGR
jgi:Putative zinc-finger